MKKSLFLWTIGCAFPMFIYWFTLFKFGSLPVMSQYALLIIFGMNSTAFYLSSYFHDRFRKEILKYTNEIGQNLDFIEKAVINQAQREALRSEKENEAKLNN